MVNLYLGLFYRFFISSYPREEGTNEKLKRRAAAWTAYLYTTLLVLTNISVLVGVFFREVLQSDGIKEALIPVAILVATFNFLLFFTDQRYERIAEKFSEQSESAEYISRIVFAIYIALSIGALIAYGFCYYSPE